MCVWGGQTKFTAEDWSVVFVLAGTAAAVFAGMKLVPNTALKDWARDEAEERLRRRAQGKDVQYGVSYAGLRAHGVDPDADSDA